MLVRTVTWQHCERTTSLTSKSYLTVTIQFKGWQLTNAPACEREMLLAEPIFECRISSEEEEDEMAALLENQNFEHAQDYIRRGRNLVGVPTPELKARWVAAFKVWATNWRQELTRKLRADLEAELSIRNDRPPYKSYRTKWTC